MSQDGVWMIDLLGTPGAAGIGPDADAAQRQVDSVIHHWGDPLAIGICPR